MPQTEIQDVTAVFTFDATNRPHRGKCARSRENMSTSALNATGAEDHVVDLQSLWVDLGGEG